MTYQEILDRSRDQIGPYCKSCKICNGMACKNTVPGPGEEGHESWAGDSWQTGGAPVWQTPAVDPELGPHRGAPLPGRERQTLLAEAAKPDADHRARPADDAAAAAAAGQQRRRVAGQREPDVEPPVARLA